MDQRCQITLGKSLISKNGNDVYVIAEIGQNHQGSISMAKDMISEAKNAGANCVKFQKSCLRAKFTSSALNRIYDSPNSFGFTYGDHKRFLEFTIDEMKELQRYSKDIGIDFTASAMDEVSLEELNSLNSLPFIKIGSGDTNNFPMLEKAAHFDCPLIISTGMQEMSVVERVVQIMKSAGKYNFALLHCISAYPTPPSDCCMQLIRIYKQKFSNVIGYSGHELGIDISIAAVLLGARIIERHFTLDKSLKGSDHKCSLTPSELQQLVKRINELKNNGILSKNENLEIHEVAELSGNSLDVKLALKDIEEKRILPSEYSCKAKLGKSIVAARNLKSGDKIEKIDICIKVSEPNGIPAEKYYEILGAILKVDILEDCPIGFEHILYSTSS